jgi:hypothetical protein
VKPKKILLTAKEKRLIEQASREKIKKRLAYEKEYDILPIEELDKLIQGSGVMSKHKNSDIHTILFPKDKYKIDDIIDFLYRNKLVPTRKAHGNIRTTKNFYRTRIRDPALFKSFSTKVLASGIEIVIGYY